MPNRRTSSTPKHRATITVGAALLAGGLLVGAPASIALADPTDGGNPKPTADAAPAPSKGVGQGGVAGTFRGEFGVTPGGLIGSAAKVPDTNTPNQVEVITQGACQTPGEGVRDRTPSNASGDSGRGPR